MTTEESTASAGNAPSHLAYQVREGKDKSFWTRIGVAWQHKDGKGFSVHLECMPLDGRISLRTANREERLTPSGAGRTARPSPQRKNNI